MKRTNWILICIILLGCVLRLIHIDKPEGLWNDEYVSWFVSSIPFNNGFWDEVLKQCHMPLYYLYLKPFNSCSDLVLRLTSVIPSVLSIPVMYLIGKEFTQKAGLIAALITASLSFLIYYAQEVRFYSLLFLFSALLLLFTIKLINTAGKFNIIGYIVSGALLVSTHILGIIYFFFNTAYVLYKKKKFPAAAVIPALVIFFIAAFFGTNVLKLIPLSQWWGKFSYTNILFLFSDFFSPILTNNINAPGVFFYNKEPLFIAMITIPTIIAGAGLILGTKKQKGLAIISLLTIFVMAVLALTGKLVFITKYSIEILPALILLVSIGLQEKLIWITLFILFHLAAVFTPYYTTKLPRPEGNKLLGDIINSTEQDKIIYTYYEPDRFLRYIKKDRPSFFISKRNRIYFIENSARILENVKIGERASVVFLDSVSFIPPNLIQKAEEMKIPEMFITFSIVRNNLIKNLNDNYKDFDIKQNGAWTVITGTKVK